MKTDELMKKVTDRMANLLDAANHKAFMQRYSHDDEITGNNKARA